MLAAAHSMLLYGVQPTHVLFRHMQATAGHLGMLKVGLEACFANNCSHMADAVSDTIDSWDCEQFIVANIPMAARRAVVPWKLGRQAGRQAD